MIRAEVEDAADAVSFADAAAGAVGEVGDFDATDCAAETGGECLAAVGGVRLQHHALGGWRLERGAVHLLVGQHKVGEA